MKIFLKRKNNCLILTFEQVLLLYRHPDIGFGGKQPRVAQAVPL